MSNITDADLDYSYGLCRDRSNSHLPLCQNYTFREEYEGPEHQEMLRVTQVVAIVVPVLFGIISIVGLFGNALVVVVVAANQQMRSTTNLLIISLALADLLFIIFCVPFTATDYALRVWPFGDFWCKMVQYLIVVTAYASVYTLVLMSFDRFLAVVHPITSMSVRTERNTLIALGVTWVVIICSSIPVYFTHKVQGYEYDGNDNNTVCVFDEKSYSKSAFQITFFATSYVIPLALICGLYQFMLLRLWRGVAPGGHVSAESLRGKKRVTRLVVVVVAIFAVCWCPIHVVLVMKSLNKYYLSATSIMIQIICHVLAYMNSCINPILYAFLSENFRKAFRKVIYCSPRNGGTAQNGRVDFEKSETRALNTKTTRANENNDFV